MGGTCEIPALKKPAIEIDIQFMDVFLICISIYYTLTEFINIGYNMFKCNFEITKPARDPWNTSKRVFSLSVEKKQ